MIYSCCDSPIQFSRYICRFHSAQLWSIDSVKYSDTIKKRLVCHVVQFFSSSETNLSVSTSVVTPSRHCRLAYFIRLRVSDSVWMGPEESVVEHCLSVNT